MMRALTTSLVLLLVNPAPVTIGAHLQPVAEEPGVSGYVLAADGTPVSEGKVIAQAAFMSTTAAIDGAGRFRFNPTRTGIHQLVVSVPGQTPYRATIVVPDSKSLRLPVIHLASAAFFRVRVVSAAGEPIPGLQVRRRLFDVSGTPIFDNSNDRESSPTDDGAITIGPFPRGILTMAVDVPPFAQTRLPDVNIGDTATILDGGTIAIQQPGAVLDVDVVDGTGAPVSSHEVFVEDARPRSPLGFSPLRTDQKGRATFDRLAAGQYRVSTAVVDRCAGVLLTASHLVRVSGNGRVETPLVAGGRAMFRITSTLGPARGLPVSASPSVPPSQVPNASRPEAPACRGATDANGRVTLTNFPPGPASLTVRLANSMYVRQVDVPRDQRELTVDIPDGFQGVHVVDAVSNQPVAGATITWTAGGARVEATTTASGDALLEGVGTAGGTLGVSALRYQKAEAQLGEPPGLPYNIALTPLPAAPTLRTRVITTAGDPLPNAVVELISANPVAVPRIAVTDAKGIVTFSDLPSGSLQLVARASGFVTSTLGVIDLTKDVLFTLSRGYRVIANVELPPAMGPQLVRMVNDSNVSMDGFLDSESDRRIDVPGRLSIGPLAPGAYILELQGAGGRRTERIRIVDRDVFTTFR